MAPRPRLKLPSLPSCSSCSRPSKLPTAVSVPLSRHFSTSPTAKSSSRAHRIPPAPPQRWVSDLRARVGKCIMFGCNEDQVARAARIVRVVAEEWRPLTAGSEGFLSGGRRGLEGQKVVWGEQDSFVGPRVFSCWSYGSDFGVESLSTGCGGWNRAGRGRNNCWDGSS